MKIKAWLLTGLLAINVGMLANTQPTQAANWHYGIPKRLRGHYTFHLHRKAVPTFGYFDIHQHYMRQQDQGMPYLTMTHLRYYKTSPSTYHFRAWAFAPAVTGGKPGTENFTLTKRGNSLWYNHWHYLKH